MNDNTTPKVSVILPVYNGRHYVAEAIDSLLAQTLRDFELLIVDDGSTDDTLPILRRYAERDTRVQVTSRANTGVVGARNELIGRARAPLLAMMDQDDISHPDRFALQVAAFEADPALVAVGSDALIIDPQGDTLCPGATPSTHEQIDAVLMSARGGWHIFSPSVMMRTDAVRRVGGYRNNYLNSEDAELFLRLGEIGRLANLPQRLLSYRVHLSSGSHTGTVVQRQSGWRAACEAAQRRGVAEPAPPSPSDVSDMASNPARTHLMWAWWALNSGNVRTARRHAATALRLSPFDRESWRTALCALRGH